MSEQNTKRPRGRPKGTGKYAADDLRRLRAFAKVKLEAPGLKLASFLKEHDIANENEIRRHQGRWAKSGDELLTEARVARDTSTGFNVLEMAKIMQSALEALGEAAQPFAAKIAASLERAETYHEASRTLGEPFALPFDVTDPQQTDAAIERFEEAMLVDEDTRSAPLANLTVSDLTLPQRYYYWSLFFFEMSRTATDEDCENSLAPDTGSRA